jgi:hypothetical protein
MALVMVLGCTTKPNVRIDQDSKVKLSEYRAFGWYKQSVAAPPASVPSDAGKVVTPTPTPTPAPASSLTEDRAHSAVADLLQAKGYVFNAETTDFRVNVILNVIERPKESSMRLGVGAGGGSGNVSGGMGLSIPVGKSSEFAAAMTIDIIDSTRNAQVWTGSYQKVVKKADASAAEITTMAETILAKFPAKQ